MTYSKDFRKQVLQIKEKDKLTIKEASERFGISARSLCRWKHQLEPKLKRDKPATKIDMAALKIDIDQYPDGYLAERAERLGVSRSCVFFAIRRLGVRYKKNPNSSKTRRKKAYCLPRSH